MPGIGRSLRNQAVRRSGSIVVELLAVIAVIGVLIAIVWGLFVLFLPALKAANLWPDGMIGWWGQAAQFAPHQRIGKREAAAWPRAIGSCTKVSRSIWFLSTPA